MSWNTPYLMNDKFGSILCNDLGAPMHVRESAARRLEDRAVRGTVKAITVMKRQVKEAA
ncbi:hypothetical protein D3C87_1254790 [compost metagenome]